MKVIVTAVVDFVVDVPGEGDAALGDADAHVRAHLEEDELVYAYSGLNRVEPFEQEIV